MAAGKHCGYSICPEIIAGKSCLATAGRHCICITYAQSLQVKLLKLVRTPLNVYFTAFKSIFLSLYAPITSDECHAWFHLNAASPAVRNAEQVNITKNSLPRLDSKHQHRTSWFPACPSNHSATETVDDIRLVLLQYLFTLRYHKNSCAVCKGIYRRWK